MGAVIKLFIKLRCHVAGIHKCKHMAS